MDYLYEGSNAVNLTVGDDVASSAITLPTSFPFGGADQTRVYVRMHWPASHMLIKSHLF